MGRREKTKQHTGTIVAKTRVGLVKSLAGPSIALPEPKPDGARQLISAVFEPGEATEQGDRVKVSGYADLTTTPVPYVLPDSQN